MLTIGKIFRLDRVGFGSHSGLWAMPSLFQVCQRERKSNLRITLKPDSRNDWNLAIDITLIN
jgi:hypothetical protein